MQAVEVACDAAICPGVVDMCYLLTHTVRQQCIAGSIPVATCYASAHAAAVLQGLASD